MEGLVMEVSKGKNENPLGIIPLNAVVSCTKNVSCSRQIATHVPSLPLSTPSSSFSDKVHNFLVRWPTDFDPSGDALSTFRLSRLMKRDSFYSDGNGLSSGFQPEDIELTIGLMRGSEMVTLGKAILIITGEENEELIIDLPVSTEKDVVKNKKKDPPALKRTNSKIFSKGSKNTVKVLKPLSFPSDKRRKFHLTENAMIRLNVSVSPDDDLGRTNSSEESGLVTNGVSSSVYSTNDTDTSSLSYSTKDFPSTEYSSREGSSSFTTATGSKDDSEHQSHGISRSRSSTKRYGSNSRRPQTKYHPHIPMDELQNVDDNFDRVHISPQMSRTSSNVRTRSLPRSRPQATHGTQAMSDVYNNVPPTRSRRSRSTSNGRAMPPPPPPVGAPNTRSSSRSRPSGRSGPSRSFGGELPSLTQHSSRTPRVPTSQKTRNSHEVEYDSGPSTPRSGSRSRARPDRYQVAEAYQQSDGYRQQRENVPRRSNSYYEEDTENENAGRRREKTRSSKPPMGNSHHHENKASENQPKPTESPMTWLYDKMVGKGTSAEETVKRKNNEGKKKVKKSGQFEGPSNSDSRYRRPSPRRTMRV